MLSIAAFSACSLNAQVDDIVEHQGISSNLHRDNIGKIFFTASNIQGKDLSKVDFLRIYNLTNKSDLFFTAFLDNSITNYLHQLSPGLPAEELVKKGNCQFSIFIDDSLIYQSNLHPGAPRPKYLDTATILMHPLIDNVKGNGIWSESFWNRFMHFGGEAALTEGKHLLRMDIAFYLMDEKEKVGKVIASGELPLLVERKPVIDIKKIKLNKLTAYDGLPLSTADFDKDKIKLLKGNIDTGVYKKINSIVIVKDGKLLVEEYFNGENRNSLHDPRSVGKTFASTIMGIAIKDNYLKNEQQTLGEFYDLKKFDNYSSAKEEVSIKDLLTMSSVFDGDDSDYDSPGNEENMYPTDDWVKFALDLPVRVNTQKDWHYFTSGVVVLGDILDKKVPGGLEKYADDKLFKPLHITDYKWEYTPQKVANTAGGIRLKALDFAKFGQLYKNNGKWNGQQIIPEKWVADSFTKQAEIKERANEYYGYLFWNKTFEIKGKKYETYYCAGNGGNYILIFKDQPWVIVITASAYGMPYAHPQVNEMLKNYIIPALIP